MDRKKAVEVYLLGTLGQIGCICSLVYLLHKFDIEQLSILGLLSIGIAGTSSAIWGIFVSNKYKHTRIKTILKNFFCIKQNLIDYILLVLFMILDFANVFISGKILINIWYVPILIFIKSILFGGIEEIGWRYTFQPILEEKTSYIKATLFTFLCWGIWHLVFFYIDGTLEIITSKELIDFYAGLLVNCFILSALYNKTKNLWMCVMAHSLINTFSQLVVGGNRIVSYVSQVCIIILAIIISKKTKKCKKY